MAGESRRPRLRGRPAEARVRVGEFAFAKKGVSAFDIRDPYHLAVTLSWPHFFLLLVGIYLGVNVIFALLYAAVPGSVANAHVHSVADAFFFSFETLATVGYGEMYPGNLYGHVVACVEIMCGLAFTAILTGLTFVRFSRPRPKFIMAEDMTVSLHNGVPTLMLRIGNGRPAPLANVRAKLNVLLTEVTAEGVRFRRAQELPLLRASLPVFPLTWTLMHRLDENSPLHGFESARMMEADTRFFLTLEAHDPVLASTVHELRMYGPQRVAFGMRYADMITTEEDGTPVADMRLIGALEPEDGMDRPIMGWTEPAHAVPDRAINAGSAASLSAPSQSRPHPPRQ